MLFEMGATSLKLLTFVFACRKTRTAYGAPLSRRRLYLLLIQEAALTDEASQMDFMEFIHKKLKAMHLHPTTTKWFLDSLPYKVAGGSLFRSL